jgi:hypothetical protein
MAHCAHRLVQIGDPVLRKPTCGASVAGLGLSILVPPTAGADCMPEHEQPRMGVVLQIDDDVAAGQVSAARTIRRS